MIYPEVQSMYLQETIEHILRYFRTYTSIFQLINNHLPKILIFQQLPSKHFLGYLSIDMSDCLFHTSMDTFSLSLRGFHLYLKQWIFFYLLTCSQNLFFSKCVIQISSLFRQTCIEHDLKSSRDRIFFPISIEKIFGCSWSKSELSDRLSPMSKFFDIDDRLFLAFKGNQIGNQFISMHTH